MLIRLTRPEPPPPRTSQRNPRLNVWRPPPSVAIHFPVGTLSPSPADAGAFCTAEGRFGLIQQLPPVLAQGVIFPGQLVGCILHHGSIANYWPESPPPSPELRNGTQAGSCCDSLPASGSLLVAQFSSALRLVGRFKVEEGSPS